MTKYSMALAALVLLSGFRPEQTEPKSYAAMAEKIKITKDAGVEEKAKTDPAWREIVERIDDRAAWARLFEELDQQLGIVSSDGVSLEVVVTAQDHGRPPAYGMSRPDRGKLEVAIPALIHAAAQFREKPVFLMKIGLMHELAHSFQRTPAGKSVSAAWPAWLVEGMAAFATDDEFLDRQFKAQGIDSADRLADVDGDVAAYRGLLVFKYLYHRLGREKLKTFVARLLQETDDALRAAEKNKTKPELDMDKALQGLTGETWDDFAAAERAWSEQYLRKLYR